MNGLILVDKPQEWTSFDVVAKIRGRLRQLSKNSKIKVGHAGTLDPMATGLLIILVGPMTKKQDDFMKKDKTYSAEITLGARSTTDDAEGEIESSELRMPVISEIQIALLTFVGRVEQMPPNYSAIKVNGKRAYALARAGEQPKLKSRNVTIHSIDNIQIVGNKVRFVCSVSSGTYIRSLARDLGEKLGCGGYLSELRRLSIGEFDVAQAQVVSDLTDELLQKILD